MGMAADYGPEAIGSVAAVFVLDDGHTTYPLLSDGVGLVELPPLVQSPLPPRT